MLYLCNCCSWLLCLIDRAVVVAGGKQGWSAGSAKLPGSRCAPHMRKSESAMSLHRVAIGCLSEMWQYRAEPRSGTPLAAGGVFSALGRPPAKSQRLNTRRAPLCTGCVTLTASPPQHSAQRGHAAAAAVLLRLALSSGRPSRFPPAAALCDAALSPPQRPSGGRRTPAAACCLLII